MMLLRHLCLTGLLATAALAQAKGVDAVLQQHAPYAVPALPYAADALEPAIDAATMGIHHDRHHQAYVDNLNKAIAQDPALQSQTLRALLAKADALSPALRTNAGGHYNHSLFWSVLAAPGQGGQPSVELAAAIEKQFGSMETFKEAFTKAATGVFGSGWAWLIVGADGSLQIATTPNQDNPLMPTAPTRGQPILALDVWEHAYYLRYQNRRPDYLAAWWSVVNWKEVSRRFDQAR